MPISSTASPGLAPYTTLALHTSTITTALLLGSTSWASLAVMPSLLSAPISTYAKLSVFKGLILRANAILPPVFLLASSSLAYLTYYSKPIVSSTGVRGVFGMGRSKLGSMLGLSRRGVYSIGLVSMITTLMLQVVIVPKNKRMLEIVQRGEGKDDDGREGNERIGELWNLNLVRVLCSIVAFGVCLSEGVA